MTKLNLRIHIAPVGFEVDRIVLSARKRKADRVYLLVHENRSDDRAGPFVDRIKRQLKGDIEVVTEHHNRLDLFEIIKSIRHIIEREAGNNIYVNLASGSKIQAIAGMMACMMFNENKNVFPFYVEAKEYLGFKGQQISTGIKDPIDIPAYEIQTPEQRHIGALKIITESGGRIRKKDMAELAERQGLIRVNAEERNHSQARFASLDKSIIQPLLLHWKFIRVEKVGRTRWIQMTEEGQNAARFLI